MIEGKEDVGGVEMVSRSCGSYSEVVLDKVTVVIWADGRR